MRLSLSVLTIAARDISPGVGPRRSLARRARSYVVWEAGLALFALTNVAILLITLIRLACSDRHPERDVERTAADPVGGMRTRFRGSGL